MTIALRHFPAGERGFFRAPVLLTGATEAILVDGGFTLEDGRALATTIKASGKKLTTVYVSHGDPDYYFSLGPIVPRSQAMSPKAIRWSLSVSTRARTRPQGARCTLRSLITTRCATARSCAWFSTNTAAVAGG